jgi:hypothetical protein
MLIPEIGITSGASLAKETPRRLEKVEITPCVQNELRIKTAMGGALSNPERALVLRAPSVLMVAWELIDIGMTEGSRTGKSAIRRTGREVLRHSPETRMGTRTRTEMPDAMVQAVAGTSHHGSRTERTRMVLQARGIATAMVIDFLTARGGGETRSAMIGVTEAIVVTEDGIEIETNGKSASQSGWMSQPRTKPKVTPKKTFRSGGSSSTKGTKLARHLPKIQPSQMPVLLSSGLTRKLKRPWKSWKRGPTSS